MKKTLRERIGALAKMNVPALREEHCKMESRRNPLVTRGSRRSLAVGGEGLNCDSKSGMFESAQRWLHPAMYGESGFSGLF
jgi:hypothetical protein